MNRSQMQLWQTVWCVGGDADTHVLLAREALGAVGMAVKKELLAPMQQWLAAYDVAQVRGCESLAVLGV
jgi:hypothetical protein